MFSRVHKAAVIINNQEPFVLPFLPDDRDPYFSAKADGMLFSQEDEEDEYDDAGNPLAKRASNFSYNPENDPRVKAARDEADNMIGQATYKAQKIMEEAEDQKRMAMHAREAAEAASQNAAAEIMAAKNQAAEILANAQVEAQTIKSTAAEEGYAEGARRGRDEMLRANEETFSALQTAVELLNREKGHLFEIYEDELIQIAATIARKVVQMELDTAEDSFIYILTQAAKKFRNAQNVTLTIREGDLSADLIADPDFLKVVFAGIGNIEIVEKSDLEPGTCIMDDGSTIVDASAETQMDLMEEELLR